MASGDRPAVKCELKSKTSDSRLALFAAWENERGGLSGKWDKDLAGWTLVSPDGKTKIPISETWCNVYDNRMGGGQAQARTAHAPQLSAANGADSDIPF